MPFVLLRNTKVKPPLGRPHGARWAHAQSFGCCLVPEPRCRRVTLHNCRTESVPQVQFILVVNEADTKRGFHRHTTRRRIALVHPNTPEVGPVQRRGYREQLLQFNPPA